MYVGSLISVWRELEKENKEFFKAYAKSREEIRAAPTTDHQFAGIQRMLSHVSDESKTPSLG